MSKRFEESKGQEAVVHAIPPCDFCRDGTPAVYDAASRQGPWGYMCESHFRQHGVGLGEGRGQKLFTSDN